MKPSHHMLWKRLFTLACWLVVLSTIANADTAAAPVFDPGGGTYTSAQTVSISSTTSGASIRYTIDSTTPSDTVGTLYTAPVTIGTATTLKAIAYATGYDNSTVTTATYNIPPIISSLTPLYGPVGTSVTIIGTHFGASQGASTVAFNGTTATVTSWSDARITTTVPSGAASGSVVITVNSSASNGKFFRVGDPPAVTSVSPASGEAGTQVTITGTGFGAAQGTGKVWLGSTYATAVSWSDTQVVATVASNARSGIARIRQDDIWSNDVSFTVNVAAITNVSPSSGAPGTQVTITGTGFGPTQGTSQVTLGTANGVVQSWSDTQIIAQVATGSASGNARVLRNGVWSNAVAFTVPALRITSIDPTSGAAPTSVTITGTGFGATQGTGSVQLGSIAGTVVTWSDTQVVATVASGAVSGVARIQQNGAWSNAETFTVPTGGTDMMLVPNIMTLSVGDTRTLQALDDSGQPVTGLTWTSSDTNVVTLSAADPPELTAVAAGHVTITAGTASADVTVVAGTLPLGTVVWSNPGTGGGVYNIVPAVPSPTGVADVFAFQYDGTVQAITSEGATAWTADVSDLYPVLPDFSGGLVGSGNNSIVRIDGTTGQRTVLYAPSGDTYVGTPLVHTDGTVFALQYTTSSGPTLNEVIGLDPDTGTPKFTVPIFSSPDANDAVGSGAIIAGDGYAYVPYQTMHPHGPPTYLCDYHIGLKRISSSGAYSDIPVHDWTGYCEEVPGLVTNMITNADTGVLMSWGGPEYLLAVTNGTSASVVSAPQVAGDNNWPIWPALQTQDGWFVGFIVDGSYNSHMVAFDANGGVRWIVPGYRPQIATDDGGVIATDDNGAAATFDSNGSATGQMASYVTQSWLGYAYQIGSVAQVLNNWRKVAQNWWSFAGANPSGNNTAVDHIYYVELDPTPKTYVFDGWYWLKQRLSESARATALDDYVFKTSNQRVAFLAYLSRKPGPEFYDGQQSKVKLSDAECGGPSGRTVKHHFELSNNANGCDIAAMTCRMGSTKLLRTFFEPRAITLSSSNDPNIALLFHEALHGFLNKDDPALQTYLDCTSGFEDTRDITLYLQQFIGALPLQGTPTTCKYIEQHGMPASLDNCVR